MRYLTQHQVLRIKINLQKVKKLWPKNWFYEILPFSKLFENFALVPSYEYPRKELRKMLTYEKIIEFLSMVEKVKTKLIFIQSFVYIHPIHIYSYYHCLYILRLRIGEFTVLNTWC